MGTETRPNDAVWPIGRLLTWTTEYLARAGLEEPRLCAELLLAHALSCRKIELYTRFEQIPDDGRRAAFRDLVRRAAAHEPIAYLVGHKEFYSLDFEVSPAVLIPRPETELLVDKVVEHCRGLGDRPVRLWDLGTGSGCIAVAVLSRVPQATAVASDVCPEALAVARRNAERHGLGGRLAFVEADGLRLPADIRNGDGGGGRDGFDILVSNPPYVAEREWASLPPEVREYEPRTALAGGEDGLAFYRWIAAEAHEALACGGSVWLELGAGQRDGVFELFGGTGRYGAGRCWREAGRNQDRVVQFVFEKG